MADIFPLLGRLRELTKQWGPIAQKLYLGGYQLIMKGKQAHSGLATQS